MNDLNESDVLEQLQSQWDAHCQRVEAILDASPRPVVVGCPGLSSRRRLLGANGLLMLMSVAYAVYWVLTAPPHAYTLPRQVFAVAFGCFLVWVAVVSGVSFAALLVARPQRVSPNRTRRWRLPRGFHSLLLVKDVPAAGPSSAQGMPSYGLRLALISLFLMASFAASACTPAADDYHLRQSREHSQSRVDVMDSITNLWVNV